MPAGSNTTKARTNLSRGHNRRPEPDSRRWLQLHFHPTWLSLIERLVGLDGAGHLSDLGQDLRRIQAATPRTIARSGVVFILLSAFSRKAMGIRRL